MRTIDSKTFLELVKGLKLNSDSNDEQITGYSTVETYEVSAYVECDGQEPTVTIEDFGQWVNDHRGNKVWFQMDYIPFQAELIKNFLIALYDAKN